MRKIVLNVVSAKVVNTNIDHSKPKKSPYKSGKYRENIDRDGNACESVNDMDDIIHINHIVNALHVMMGARPVSFKYGDVTKLSPKLINIVENGILRYDNIFKGKIKYNDENIKTVFYNEFTQGKKAAYNSNRNGLTTVASNGEIMYANFNWSSIEKLSFYNSNYKEVLDIINEYANFINCQNIRKQYTLLDVFVKIKYENPEWIEKFQAKHLKISPIINFLVDTGKKAGDGYNAMGSLNLAGLGNVNAPIPKVSVDATIILFMEDEDAEQLLNGKRYASILDNGFIYIANTNDGKVIDSIRDFSVVDDIDEYVEDYLDEGFVKINNLPYTNGKNKN